MRPVVHRCEGDSPTITCGVATGSRLHYANGMTRQALLALILVPGMAHAVICKTVDSEGVVSYTNVPAVTCPDPVKLPKYSTFEALPVPASATRSESEVEESADKARFERYESIKIIQPEAAGVVRSNEGNVSVSIALEPGLQRALGDPLAHPVADDEGIDRPALVGLKVVGKDRSRAVRAPRAIVAAVQLVFAAGVGVERVVVLRVVDSVVVVDDEDVAVVCDSRTFDLFSNEPVGGRDARADPR